MGLADRHYMRGRPRWGALSMTTLLTIVMVVIYALQCINDVYIHSRAELWLALTPAWLLSGHVWQLLTFQFLHANVLHITCNLIGFWWVGHFVENVLGKRRFLIALFGSGIIGGLLQGVLMILFPLHFGFMVVGASAGISGLFAIFALLESESTVRFNFVLPVRAITLLWFYGAISLFFTLVPTHREMNMMVAYAAHLGGLLTGVAWVKLGWHRDYIRLPWEALYDRFVAWRPLKARHRKRELVKAASIKVARWPALKSETSADLPEEEFMSREVDPILDKITAHGIQSLTDQERRILEAARNKMPKR